MFWAHFLCRICATIGTNSYPIFEKTSNRNIDAKIKRCLNITIFEDDLKPKVICEGCYNKLNDLFEFIELCESANNKFDHILYQSGRSLDNSWHSNVSTDNIVQESVNCVVLEPKASNSEFLTIIDYKESANISYEAQPTAIDKNLYEESFGQRYHENSTVLRHSSQFQNKSKHIVLSQESNDELIPNYSSVEKPCKKEINGTVTNATTVEETTVKQTKLNRRHGNLISVESIINTMKENADNSFRNAEQDLSNNAEQTSKTKKNYSCAECHKSFTRKFNLTAHVSRHANNKPFICDKCNKTFVLKSELTTHKKLHASQYKCKTCEKVFPAPSKLEKHLRIHANERIFSCTHANCNKAFTDKRNLVGHMVMHSNERNFSCEMCSKSFKTKNKLKSHMNVHSDLPVYICNFCPASYKWKPNFLKHIKKHSE